MEFLKGAPLNKGLIFSTLILISAFFLIGAGDARIAAGDEQAALKTAVGSYKSARFDAAIDMLTDIVNTETADIEIRKEALRYLGRCYIAKRLNDKAKDAILELLELEPPLVMLDPDRESPPMMKVYYEARKQKAGNDEVEKQDPGIKTMAIVDFRNRSILDNREKYDAMEMGFSDIMISRLNGATELKVVERERIQWILDEHKIQNQFDMEGAVRAGRLLGAHVVLLGSFIVHSKSELWISARLVKVETSEILMTADVKGKVDKFFELTEKLSKDVAEKIDIDEAEISRSSDPQSLEAMLAYSEGLDLLEEDKYDEAYGKFQLALEYDPQYERARQKAENIRMLTSTIAQAN